MTNLDNYEWDFSKSNWANSLYNKDEEVTIDVYNGFGFDSKYCTYHA